MAQWLRNTDLESSKSSPMLILFCLTHWRQGSFSGFELPTLPPSEVWLYFSGISRVKSFRSVWKKKKSSLIGLQPGGKQLHKSEFHEMHKRCGYSKRVTGHQQRALWCHQQESAMTHSQFSLCIHSSIRSAFCGVVISVLLCLLVCLFLFLQPFPVSFWKATGTYTQFW